LDHGGTTITSAVVEMSLSNTNPPPEKCNITSGVQ